MAETNEVTIEYLNGSIEYAVDYGATRKIRFRWMFTEELTDKASEGIDELHAYVRYTMQKPEVLRRMNDVSYCKLIEKVATKFCRYYAPTRRFGLDKAAIRQAIAWQLKDIEEESDEDSFYTLRKIEEAI